MTILDELVTLIDGLDTEGHDHQNVKTIKRLVHNLQKITENMEHTK